MVNLLFVCHGNICRSPMAEFVMKRLVSDAGLDAFFHIESAALRDDELGSPVHRGTRRVLEKRGISCDGKTARKVVRKDYDAFDLIVGMDHENEEDMRDFFNDDPKNKCRLLLSFAGSNRVVSDPWYHGDFEQTYDDVVKGCEALLEYCKKNYLNR